LVPVDAADIFISGASYIIELRQLRTGADGMLIGISRFGAIKAWLGRAVLSRRLCGWGLVSARSGLRSATTDSLLAFILAAQGSILRISAVEFPVLLRRNALHW